MAKKTKLTGQRSATPADKALGIKVRQARNLAGMSQAELGDRLGVTFQQIQKYEKGVNRVGGTRLVELAKALEKPVSFFLEEATYKPNSKGEKIAQFVASREGTQICELLADMHHEIRAEILGICRSLSRVAMREAA
jgi:transcriptional regulator with XRE-family HTH domain